MFHWQVMELCEKQLRDINPDDVLFGGLYRKCNIYKGGGGYDKFESIFRSRNHDNHDYDNVNLNEQFVVQLKDCPLRCPYCYVTPEGASTGEHLNVTTERLVNDFYTTGLNVFHLMGGAPALYLDEWPALLHEMYDGKDYSQYFVFHSDFLLVEERYNISTCREIAKYAPHSLYAVSIKGCDAEEFKKNAGVALNEKLFWLNLDTLINTKVPFYFTFTGMNETSISKFTEKLQYRYGDELAEELLKDSFPIQLVHYKALD